MVDRKAERKVGRLVEEVARVAGGDPGSVAIVPRLVPFVVGEGKGGGAFLDEAGELLGDAGPREEAAGLVCAHAGEAMGEARMAQDLHDRDAEVLLVE